MALKKKMKMIRILAIAVALVVLLSCIPVLPAAAADSIGVYVDGELVLSTDLSSFTLRILVGLDQPNLYSLIIEETSKSVTLEYSGDYIFQGLSLDSWVCDYPIGTDTRISVSKDIYLLQSHYYTLTVDPAGGYWYQDGEYYDNATEFVDAPGADIDSILDPKRPGFTFKGWLLRGPGTLYDIEDESRSSYTYGAGDAFLIAQWTNDSGTSEGSTLSGVWQFVEQTAAVISEISQDILFVSNSRTYSELGFYPGAMRYFYDTGSDKSAERGIVYYHFVDDSYRVVDFGNTLQPVSQEFFDYFTSYAVRISDSDPGDQTAVLQAGQWECNSLVMTGEYVDLDPWPDGLAAVPLNFTSSGQSFSSMSGQYDFAFGDCVYYDDSRAYKYSDLTGTAEASWQTEAYALVYLAADQEVPQAFYNWFTSNFKRVSSDPVLPTYYTTVNIYDSNGSTLLHSVQFSDTNAAPVASLSVTQDGCTISYGDQTSSWVAGDMTYYGFKLTAGSVGPTYSPGLPYMLPGGQASDVVINLYVADSEGVLGDFDPPSVIAAFFEIMIRPVMSFFQAEFVPGYSLGKICLFSLLLGLLFWFLATHKS